MRVETAISLVGRENPSVILVFMHMHDLILQSGTGKVTRTVSDIAKDCYLSGRTVDRAMASLVGKRLIYRNQADYQQPNTYWLGVLR